MIRVLRPVNTYTPGMLLADSVFRPDQVTAMVRAGVAEVIPDPPKPKRDRQRKDQGHELRDVGATKDHVGDHDDGG
jgi:hypothetical protein